MGRIIQYRLLQSENQTGLMRPVVYCDEKYCESLQQVSLNEKMAALLIKIKPERRTMRIERCFQEVLTNIPENSCIRDFDVLFNPAYKIDKLISTLKEFDVLRCEKPGKYHINRMTVNNEQVSAFMAYAVMNIDDSGYYSFQELNDSVYLFPFEYHVEKETIVSDDRFSISTFGGEISISLT